MKKLMIIKTLLLLGSKEYAQIEKGTFVPSISLNCGYSSSPSKEVDISSTTNYSWHTQTTLGFGKFIKENLSLSGSFSFGNTYQKSEFVNNTILQNSYNDVSHSHNSTLSATLLKHKFIKENFAIRYGYSLGINYSESISDRSDYSTNTDAYGNPTIVYNHTSSYKNTLGLTGNFQAGILYFINRNFALTGSMGFFSASYDINPYQLKNKTTESHSLSVSLTPSFNAFTAGLTYYIRPKAN